ncbi:carbon-nitrogen hydrolase [Phyllosticta citribraziliensis]|uniref:nitrilase n=1 Tax=Phyllosticta citribraziliensis TaxID=989973 RepID=A0ABR1L2Q0_9PEZI
MTEQKSHVRVAAVQAEPCYFDLQGGVAKTIRLIEEAGAKGCDLIAFPEVWIPQYPAWIWQRPLDTEMVQLYMKNSLRRESPEMDKICAAAAKNKVAVCLGYSENDKHSLYISQSLIGKDGKIKMHRRKIKPTHAERTIYGDGSGASLLNVADEPGVGRIGALSCWEHSQPLLRYHTYSQGEEIHVAAWPPMSSHKSYPEGTISFAMCREGAQTLSTTHAIEGNTFVVLASTFYTKEGLDLMKMGDENPIYRTGGGGHSCVIGPDGRKLTEDLGEQEEGLVIADCNMSEIMNFKALLDVHGHYSRPDLLWLGVDSREKLQVRQEV